MDLHMFTDLFEALTIFCFGLSWPISIRKSYISRTAKGKSHYVLSGKGEECYRPTFTFFGFRFVEISADGDIEITSFRAEVVGSDTKEIGCMETSDELVNKLCGANIFDE